MRDAPAPSPAVPAPSSTSTCAIVWPKRIVTPLAANPRSKRSAAAGSALKSKTWSFMPTNDTSSPRLSAASTHLSAIIDAPLTSTRPHAGSSNAAFIRSASSIVRSTSGS